MREWALAVLQPGFEGLEPPAWLLRSLDEGLGGVALFARNVRDLDQVARLNAAVHEANPAALVTIDEEGGDVTRMQHATGSSWPGNLALGVVDDVALTERVAAEMGAMLAGVGVDLDYAPDADTNVNADNPVIGVRSFGSDPVLVARHTAAWVRGLQSAGVLACAKHFPGHGDTDTDSHLDVPVVDLGADPTASPWLIPFRAAVSAGVASIMSAHVIVPSLDARPGTLAPAVMTGLLRDELGFTGLALSDGLEMGAVVQSVGLLDGAVLAIAAGVDAICVGGGLADEETVEALVGALVDAVTDGRLPEERLAEAAERVAQAAAYRDRLRDSASRAGLAGHDAGLEAGRRAVRVTGPTRRDPRAPLVLELAAPSNIAVGDDTPAGLVTAVRERWPYARVERVSGVDGFPGPSPDGVSPGPVWALVRDPHRHAWMRDAVAVLADQHPGLVVVDTGWPGWTAPVGVTHVVTHGASYAGGRAVVDLLTP